MLKFQSSKVREIPTIILELNNMSIKKEIWPNPSKGLLRSSVCVVDAQNGYLEFTIVIFRWIVRASDRDRVISLRLRYGHL